VSNVISLGAHRAAVRLQGDAREAERQAEWDRVSEREFQMAGAEGRKACERARAAGFRWADATSVCYRKSAFGRFVIVFAHGAAATSDGLAVHSRGKLFPWENNE